MQLITNIIYYRFFGAFLGGRTPQLDYIDWHFWTFFYILDIHFTYIQKKSFFNVNKFLFILSFFSILFIGYFRHYDYGILNLVKYGSLIPPDYEVGNIVAPVALFYGNNDLLSAVTVGFCSMCIFANFIYVFYRTWKTWFSVYRMWCTRNR